MTAKHYPYLRGATHGVYQAICSHIAQGNHQPAMLDLSLECGYSLTAVQYAIRELEALYFIVVERRAGHVPNRYSLVEPQQRVEFIQQYVQQLQP